MPTDLSEMSRYTQVCRCLTECCCGCCRYGVGAPLRPTKLLKGLCEVHWPVLLNLTGCVKSGRRVEHGGLCKVVCVVRVVSK